MKMKPFIEWIIKVAITHVPQLLVNGKYDIPPEVQNYLPYICEGLGDFAEKMIEAIPEKKERFNVEAKDLLKSSFKDAFYESTIEALGSVIDECADSFANHFISDISFQDVNDDGLSCQLKQVVLLALQENDVNLENIDNEINQIVKKTQFNIINNIGCSSSLQQVLCVNSIKDLYNEIRMIKDCSRSKKLILNAAEIRTNYAILCSKIDKMNLGLNKRCKELCFEFLSEIETRDKKYNNNGKKQPLVQLVDYAWRNTKKGSKNIIITADGGMGKTSSFFKAIRTINQSFIRGYKKDGEKTKKPFAIYIPCFKFEEKSLENSETTINMAVADTLNWAEDHSADCVSFLNSLMQNNRIIIFFDGYNELIYGKRQTFLTSLSQLKQYDKVQVVLSSRVVPESAGEYTRCKMIGVPLMIIQSKLDSRKKRYDELPISVQNLLRYPMFLRIYLESTGNVTSISDLLEEDRQKALKLMKEKEDNLHLSGLARDTSLFLYSSVPAFFHALYLKNEKSMIFYKEDVEAYFGKTKKNEVEDILNSLCSFAISEEYISANNVVYKYKHEHIRDFYIAYYVFKEIKNASESDDEGYNTIANIIKNQYAQTILRMIAELFRQNDYVPFYDSNTNQMITPDYEESELYTVLTKFRKDPFVVNFLFNIIKSAYLDCDVVDLSGFYFDKMDLTQTSLNGIVLNGSLQSEECSFEQTTLSEKSFISSGHTTAAYTCYVVNHKCFSFSNTELIISSDTGFEEREVVPFGDDLLGYYIKAHGLLDNSTIIVSHIKDDGVEDDSMISIWDLARKTYTLHKTKSHACSIETYQHICYLSCADGSIWRLSEDLKPKEVFGQDNTGCLVDTSIAVITENKVVQAAGKNIFRIDLKQNNKTILYQLKETEVFRCMCYSREAKLLLVCTSTSQRECIRQIQMVRNMEVISENTVENIAQCSYIACQGKKALIADKDGKLCLLELFKEGDKTLFHISQDNKLNSHKAAIRHIVFKDEFTFLTACVDRCVRLCSFSGDVLFTLEGQNAGLRKLYIDEGQLIVTSYDRGILCLQPRNNLYICTKKHYNQGKIGWNWYIEKIQDSIFAVGDDNGNLIIININTGRQLLKKKVSNSEEKIECILYQNGFLYVCALNKIIIYRICIDENIIIESFDTFFLRQNERALSFCSVQNQILIGAQYKNNPELFFGLPESLQRVSFINTEYTGWCRDIKTLKINNQTFLLMSGFSKKHQRECNQMSIVCKLEQGNLRIIAELVGHVNYVIRGDWMEDAETGRIIVASASVDKKVLIYSLDRYALLNHTIHSYEPMDSFELGGTVCDVVFQDSRFLLAACLDGGLYQIDTCRQECRKLFQNTYGLFINSIDFSTSNMDNISNKTKNLLRYFNNTVGEDT